MTNIIVSRFFTEEEGLTGRKSRPSIRRRILRIFLITSKLTELAVFHARDRGKLLGNDAESNEGAIPPLSTPIELGYWAPLRLINFSRLSVWAWFTS